MLLRRDGHAGEGGTGPRVGLAQPPLPAASPPPRRYGDAEMNWLAMAVMTSIAALVAGAVGWSGRSASARSLSRSLFAIFLVLALVLFLVAAVREALPS